MTSEAIKAMREDTLRRLAKLRNTGHYECSPEQHGIVVDSLYVIAHSLTDVTETAERIASSVEAMAKAIQEPAPAAGGDLLDWTAVLKRCSVWFAVGAGLSGGPVIAFLLLRSPQLLAGLFSGGGG